MAFIDAIKTGEHTKILIYLLRAAAFAATQKYQTIWCQNKNSNISSCNKYWIHLELFCRRKKSSKTTSFAVFPKFPRFYRCLLNKYTFGHDKNEVQIRSFNLSSANEKANFNLLTDMISSTTVFFVHRLFSLFSILRCYYHHSCKLCLIREMRQ